MTTVSDIICFQWPLSIQDEVNGDLKYKLGQSTI